MIDVAVKWDKGELRSGLELAIANHMKKSYINWNKETVDDEVIFIHLNELSEGSINLVGSTEQLTPTEQLLKNKNMRSNRSSFGSKKNNRNNRNKKNNK